MPRIAEFNLPQGETLQPNDMAAGTAREAGTVENRLGQEAGRALGGAIQTVGRQVGEDINRHIASQEKGLGAASSTTLTANLLNGWNDVAKNAPVEDFSVGQGYLEKTVEPSIQKWLSSFDNAQPDTQAWSQNQADKMRNAISGTIHADSSTRAGVAAVKNVTDMVGSSISMVTSNPDQLGFAQQNLESNVKDIISTHPNLTSDQAARITAEIPKFQWEVTKNALWSMGKTNPDQMKQDIVAGNIDIPAEYKSEALRMADEAKRDFDRQKLVADEGQKREQEAKQTKNYGDGVGLALQNTPLSQQKISEMSRNGDLSGTQAENLAGFPVRLAQMHRDKTENTPHPQQFMQVMDDLHDAQVKNNLNMTDKPIWDAWNDGNLNKSEFNEALSYYRNASKPGETEFNKMLSTTESAMNGNLKIYGLKQADPDTYAADLNSMRADAYQRFENARNAGEDVSKMLDPKSSDYLFKNASAYFTPPKQAIAAGADKARKPSAYKTEEDARAAGNSKGDRVIINGVSGTLQ